MGSGHMSQCRTSAFHDHLDQGFTVLQDVQHSSFVRRIHICGNKNGHWTIQDVPEKIGALI